MFRVLLVGAGATAIVVGRKVLRKAKDEGPSGALEIMAKGASCVESGLGPCSPQDLLVGLAALSKETEKNPPKPPGKESELAKDPVFLAQVQHWRAHVEASYGCNSGEWSLLTSLPENHILTAKWSPDNKTLRPAYVVSIDPPLGAVVLAVRGTQDITDMMLNAATSPEEFQGGKAHGGFIHATNELMKEIEDPIQEAMGTLKETCEPRLVIVGHSLGCAVGIMCGMLLRKQYPSLHCWGLGPPACMSMDLAKGCSDFATCLALHHDLIPRFSIATVEKLRQKIVKIDWDEAEEANKDDPDFKNIRKAADTMTSMQQTQQGAAGKLDEVKGNMINTFSDGENNDRKNESNGVNGQEDKRQDGEEEGQQGEAKEDQSNPVMLYPPGKLLVLCSDPLGCGKLPESRQEFPQQRQMGSYPSYEEAKKVTWTMTEAIQEDFDEIVVSAWCASDHMPGMVAEGLSYFQRHVPPLI